jgi:anti-sigma regulatory factor (Ser/Thr protein kinase)
MALHIEDGYVVVSVEDDGRPFDPRAVEAPNLAESIEERRSGGWGLHLVRLMSDDMTYRRLGDRNQVQVRVALEPART